MKRTRRRKPAPRRAEPAAPQPAVLVLRGAGARLTQCAWRAPVTAWRVHLPPYDTRRVPTVSHLREAHRS